MHLNSHLHDELVREIGHGLPQDSIRSLTRGIADRIQSAQGNPVKLSDLMSVLREDTSKMSKAILRRDA